MNESLGTGVNGQTGINAAGNDAPSEIEYVDGELVRLLALGTSQVKAAGELDISTRTIRRRLDNPDFRRRVADARRELHAESWSMLLGLREKAARVLEDSLESDEERLRLTAAKYVFEMGSRTRREQILDEIQERIDNLDDRLNAGETSEHS